MCPLIFDRLGVVGAIATDRSYSRAICGRGVRQLETEVIWGPMEVHQEDVGSGQRPRGELRWDNRVEAGEKAANRERG